MITLRASSREGSASASALAFGTGCLFDPAGGVDALLGDDATSGEYSLLSPSHVDILPLGRSPQSDTTGLGD